MFHVSFHTMVTLRVFYYAPPDTGVSDLIPVAVERLPSIEGAVEIRRDFTFLRGTPKAPLPGELSAVRLTEGLFPAAAGQRLPFQGSCLRSRLRGCCKFATTSPSRLRRATSPGRGGLWPHFASQMVFARPSAASRRPMQRSRDVEAQTTPWPPSRQMGLSASASPIPRWISCVPGLP